MVEGGRERMGDTREEEREGEKGGTGEERDGESREW